MNIYDIAKEAGVSIATISRVVNGKTVVRGKTREKVEAVLKKYNYTPDPTARSLVIKSTKTVALLLEDTRDPYCAGVAYHAERALSKAGYAVLLRSTGGGAAGIGAALRQALVRRADAVIVAGMTRGAHADVASAASTVPCVVINHRMEAPGVYPVACDETYGMMLAVGHLVGKGRRDILYVQDCPEQSDSAARLDEGFRGGMEMYDLAADGRMLKTERGFDGGYACAETLLKDGQHTFNALICGDDSTAAGMIACLRANFIDVPQDVSVVGFGNAPAAQYAVPPLTTVDCRADRAGDAAARLLLTLFASESAQPPEEILPRLVIRAST